MSVATRTKRRPLPKRGPLPSNDINAFMGEVAGDLTTIATEVNALETEIDNVHLVRYHESMASRAQIDALYNDRKIRNLFAAAAGESLITPVDFRGLLGPDFEVSYQGLAEARRARVEPLYGQVLLPYNHAVNRIYGVDVDTGETVLPGTIEIEVTGFDQGGTVVTGTKKYAVNGNDQTYWIRKVRFAVESDVDYVEVTYQVNLPTVQTSYVNMISVHPFPIGLVDITELKYSSTTADPTTNVPGFTAVNCASYQRYHFADVSMTKVKIKLRQRNFVEEKGFKVFYLGMQELLLQLVEFDKTANTVPGPLGPNNGNGVAVRIDAPTGYIFNQITRFQSSPTYAIPASDNKIYFRIYQDANFASEIWSGWTDPAPQDTPLSIAALNLSSVYVLLTMEWDSTNSVSPVLDWFAMKYTVQV